MDAEESRDRDQHAGYDVPITVDEETARAIRDDLKNDERVSIDFDREDAPDLIDHLEWQLENETPILRFVEDYDA